MTKREKLIDIKTRNIKGKIQICRRGKCSFEYIKDLQFELNHVADYVDYYRDVNMYKMCQVHDITFKDYIDGKRPPEFNENWVSIYR